ncbi:MAG: FAD:protein FMN transferase [Ferruginibacter sp.]
MGSPFNIILYTTDSATAKNTAGNCFALVDSLVYIFSDYIDSSELNRLCATAGKSTTGMRVSEPLLDILSQSKHAFEKSNGTFDITLGPVTRLWRKARKEHVFPTEAAVKEKLALTGFNKIMIDSAQQTVRLTQAGMQLDLGGIAQGYIAQKVIDLLKENDIANALVDVSGDIVAIGKPPDAMGWTIGVNVPESGDELQKQLLLISNKAVTTSGDVYQFFEHNGKRYSHIINPKTGFGTTSQRNVTVIADDGTLADWLTKACSLLPVKKAIKLVNYYGAELLIAEIKNFKLKTYQSKNFKLYFKPANSH